ncbi:hypothetical protein B6S44_02175 [Bosea sp. Tri-44]|uniref:hypothetical protein n=1 Tax=Bosea sp. Tri-44 TaxID=1972137 RepID=UPI00100EB443|nr:hypothetical protein [Bosea sp. Tri-44]RXT57264.1 hypothetical protein B6S44_02175 [Bosea sp. Tri-44]
MADKTGSIKLRSPNDVGRFLNDKPREWAEMVVARSGLRALPVLALILRIRPDSDISSGDRTLPLLRALLLPWLTALASSRDGELRDRARSIYSDAHARAQDHAADVAKVAVQAAMLIISSTYHHSFGNRYSREIAEAVDAAIPEQGAALAAVSYDALQVAAGGGGAGDLRSWPLWPDGQVPDSIASHWRRFAATLETAEHGADWRVVWLDWYEALRDGRAPWGLRRQTGEALLIEAMLWPKEEWSKGAAHINRRIAELIEAARESRGEAPPDDSAVAAPDAEMLPPAEPLPGQNSAVRFGVVAGKVEVLPTQAWGENALRADPYFNRAVQLAEGLHVRLQGSNAVPDVAGAVAALLAVLGGGVERVEPDLLRMSARSIASKARSYGHPQAEWELNPDAVSELFELDGALVDLQSFVRGAIAANEAEIRALDLKPDQAAAIKHAVDELSDAIVAEPALFSAETQAVFASAAVAGDTALDPLAATTIQASRLLVAESLTRTLALEVARNESASVEQGSSKDAGPAQDEAGASAPPGGRPSPRDRKAAAQGAESADAQAWSHFTTRLLDRIGKKGPDKIGDAVIDAVCSAIRHAPKTIPAVGAALVAMVWSNPVLAASSGLTISASWIGYELWKRSRQPK